MTGINYLLVNIALFEQGKCQFHGLVVVVTVDPIPLVN